MQHPKYTYDTLSFAFALLQELEKQRFDSVNKVQNRNEELEREKRQLEKQLKDLNAELDQQKVAQQRLGSNFTYFFPYMKSRYDHRNNENRSKVFPKSIGRLEL